MRVFHGIPAAKGSVAPRAIAIGIFDGVHKGHQKILQAMLRRARSLKAIPTVVTFDPHPAKVLAPKKHHPTSIISLEHRLKEFERSGVRETIVIPFSRRLAAVTHENFLHRDLQAHLGLRALVVGHDFCFGRQALGTVDYLKRVSAVQGFVLDVVGPVKLRGQVISSTVIRRLIERGRLALAGEMLGRPVSLAGLVVRGQGRGRRLGFPTANIAPDHETIPPAGVYAVYGRFRNRLLKGVLHIGPRPTFAEKQPSLEAHFFDFDGSLYRERLEVIFVHKIRPVRRFASAKALVRAIQRDVRGAKQILRKATFKTLHSNTPQV